MVWVSNDFHDMIRGHDEIRDFPYDVLSEIM